MENADTDLGLKEILVDILPSLQKLPGVYRFDGSVSLLVQGIETRWNDIDLRCDRKFVESFSSSYSDRIVKQGYDEKKISILFCLILME